MSGRKHHFIPKLYQCGFLAPGPGEQVWQYRRLKDGPFLTSIADVGAQRDFHGKPNQAGISPLDDEITDYERLLDKDIKTLRALPDGPIGESELITSAAAHLIIRARHTRLAMQGMMEKLFETLLTLMTDTEILRSAIGLDAEVFHPKLEAMLQMELTKSGAEQRFGLKRKTLERYMRYIVRERFDQFFPSHVRTLSPEITALGEKADETSRDTHLRALDASLVPDKRVERLSELSWSIRTAEELPVIVPDCVGLWVTKSGQWRPALFAEKTNEAGFVIPIDQTRLAIGLVDPENEIDLSAYTENAIACSSEFFIAPCEAESLAQLMPKIGTILDQHVDKLLSEASQEALSEFGLVEDMSAMPASDEREPVTENSSINFQFLGGISKEDAQAIANEAASYVQLYSRDYPIDHLDGVTYASNLIEAADELAETTGANPVYPSESDLYSSVATYQSVPGAVGEKLRPIIHLDYAHALVCEDIDFRRQAVALLFGGLASASLKQIRSEAFPTGLDIAEFGLLESTFMFNGGEGFSTYYTTRVSAFLVQTPFGDFEDELITLLERAAIGMMWAHERRQNGEDIDTVYLPALSISSSILLLAARIAARLDAADPDLVTPEGLLDRLRPFGLDQWFNLLRRDLAQTFAKLPNHSKRDILVTVSHFERLLWAMGVVPEPYEGDQLWVHLGMLPSLGGGD
ncbi:MAG: hypothetical protein AAFZ74_19015 [Pseudomonadota bacterium]